MRRLSEFRARLWNKVGAVMASGSGSSQLIGARRHGRVCVGVFKPPDAAGQYAAWRDANDGLYGPELDWYVDIGSAADGRDFVMVWVPAEHANLDG